MSHAVDKHCFFMDMQKVVEFGRYGISFNAGLLSEYKISAQVVSVEEKLFYFCANGTMYVEGDPSQR